MKILPDQDSSVNRKKKGENPTPHYSPFFAREDDVIDAIIVKISIGQGLGGDRWDAVFSQQSSIHQVHQCHSVPAHYSSHILKYNVLGL